MGTQSSRTLAGSINRNSQKNNGKTQEKGSDYGQWFYEMECQNCHYIYKANGTDIFQRNVLNVRMADRRNINKAKHMF